MHPAQHLRKRHGRKRCRRQRFIVPVSLSRHGIVVLSTLRPSDSSPPLVLACVASSRSIHISPYRPSSVPPIMIIPPDPEKDPNIFSPSSSTPSLVPAPSEHSYFGTASWDGESLPPYEGRRRSRISFAADQSSDTRHTREGDVFSDENATHLQEMRERNPRPGLGVVIPATVINPAYQQSPGSSLGSVTPTATGPNASLPSFHSTHPAHSYAESSIVPASNTAPVASTSKLWESPSSQPSGPTRRILCLSPAASRALYKWWKKWRTWVLVLLVVILVGVALMIGLLLGMHSSKHDTGVAIPPWEDNNSNDDGKKSAIWQQGGSPNLTYVESRVSWVFRLGEGRRLT